MSVLKTYLVVAFVFCRKRVVCLYAAVRACPRAPALRSRLSVHPLFLLTHALAFSCYVPIKLYHMSASESKTNMYSCLSCTTNWIRDSSRVGDSLITRMFIRLTND